MTYAETRVKRNTIAAALCLALLAVAPARGIVSCAKGKFGQEKYLQLTVHSEMQDDPNKLALKPFRDNDGGETGDDDGQAVFCARVDTKTTNTDTGVCEHPTGYAGATSDEAMTIGNACPFTGTPREVPYRRSGGEKNRYSSGGGRDGSLDWKVRTRKR